MGGNTISLKIDGRKRTAKKGHTILEVAREAGIEIPTLCYHEALTPIGSCRLCVVEITQGGRTRTAASCVTPAEAGMNVKTDTDRIREIRKMVIMLLLARCPDLEVIKQKAREIGVRRTPFSKGDSTCYLCGMCVRACREIVGIGAIGFANRGPQSEVLPPFGQESNVCVGCGTCTAICPAGTFDLERVFARRSLHVIGGKEDIYRCIICESHYGST
jgi:NADH dehydrogenase/NADH:ubiquinone oxidoreductase subunit G